jgi:hypothetical protein
MKVLKLGVVDFLFFIGLVILLAAVLYLNTVLGKAI